MGQDELIARHGSDPCVVQRDLDRAAFDKPFENFYRIDIIDRTIFGKSHEDRSLGKCVASSVSPDT